MSDWTVDTLKEYFEQAIRDQALAITKAEDAAEKRFASVNEFRAQLNDQATTFATRRELSEIVGRIERLDSAYKTAVISIVVAGVVSVISIIVAFLT